LEDESNVYIDLKQTGEPKPSPWGFWATVGFSAIIGVVYLHVQVVIIAAVTIVALFRDPNLEINKLVDGLSMNGLLQTTVICVVAPFTIGLIILFVKMRKGITIKQYLGLFNPGWREILKWGLVVFVFAGLFDTLSFLLDRPVVPEFMVSVYKTAYFVPALWLAIVIVAPLTEEIFFRSFLFEGIRSSKMGPVAAVILTSLAWAAMHTQYDVYGMGTIFLVGLLLGFVRIKSGSIYTPVVMHVVHNLIATIEVIIYLRIVPNAV
jgi:membrane protease YdiL (CAAX protease family)